MLATINQVFNLIKEVNVRNENWILRLWIYL